MEAVSTNGFSVDLAVGITGEAVRHLEVVVAQDLSFQLIEQDDFKWSGK